METRAETVNGVEYKVTKDGTWFMKDTPEEVIDLLEYARVMEHYVWMRLGDRETGRDWLLEEDDVTGFVGRSTGPVKVPLLLPTRRSIGGSAILTGCILKLVVFYKGRRKTWTAANYQKPELKVDYNDNGTDRGFWIVRRVHDDQTILARFKNPKKAKRRIDFITGERLNK